MDPTAEGKSQWNGWEMEVSKGRLLAKHVCVGGCLREDSKNVVACSMEWTEMEKPEGRLLARHVVLEVITESVISTEVQYSSTNARCTVCTFNIFTVLTKVATSSKSERCQILGRSHFYNA
jgi:hypothetical protein